MLKVEKREKKKRRGKGGGENPEPGPFASQRRDAWCFTVVETGRNKRVVSPKNLTDSSW